MINKKNSSIYIVLALAVVLYSALVWLPPWEKTGNLLISYLFTLLAIAIVFFVWKFAWEESADAVSKFYGIPVIRVGLLYVGIQAGSSFLVMPFGKWIPGWFTVLLNIVLLCLFLFGIISAKEIKNQIDAMEKIQNTQTLVIERLRAEAKYLSHTFQNPETEKRLHQIEEQLKYSDPVSSPSLETEEKELVLLLAQIKEALQENNLNQFEKLADRFLADLSRRNDLCKIYK